MIRLYTVDNESNRGAPTLLAPSACSASVTLVAVTVDL